MSPFAKACLILTCLFLLLITFGCAAPQPHRNLAKGVACVQKNNC